MPKLNLGMVEQQAQELREREEKRDNRATGGGTSGGQKDFKFFDFRPGANYIRLLEPTFEDGRLAMMIARHEIDNKKYLCIQKTWPQARIECPFCKVRYDLYPQVGDLTKRLYTKQAAWTSCIRRDDMATGVQLIRIVSTVYNFLVQQTTMRDPMTKQFVYGDITDTETGRDIVITYANNTYTTAIMPNVSPLNQDRAVAEQWLKERYHPDRIWKMPDEKVIAEYQKVAEQQRTYILQQFHGETNRAVQAAPPPPMTNSPATSSANRPRCYALDWREPKSLQQPTKCVTCPVDIPCSEEVKQKIAAGIPLPTEQTPMR
jgi:hypothetical protein